MSKIKLLVCYHKESHLFKDDILTPIHVGRSCAENRLDHNSKNYKWLMNNLIGDNTGENISDKNDTYNEMTALYWAWKNYKELGNPEYIGLMHYRRHFVLRENEIKVYEIKDFNPDTYFDEINYSEDNLLDLIDGMDFLPHYGRVANVYNHFIENQRVEDIELANEILLEKFPDYKNVMEEYYAGDLSNFCNMCIFSKKLFFEYCEFIFSILEEFEQRVDVSEKRFFISERLTGIFIAKLMKNKDLKHKLLPISFIDEPTEIPVVLNINNTNKLNNAVVITSILENAKSKCTYHFYLVGKEKNIIEDRDNYNVFVEKYSFCKVDYISTDLPEGLIPLVIPKLIPTINKCIYLSGYVITLFDIDEFYRICSTDDYFIVGTPEDKYDPKELAKEIKNNILVLNCRRMRMHQIAEKAIERYLSDDFVNEKILLHELCNKEIGYIPWYLFTSEKGLFNTDKIFHNNKSRARIQKETLWRPFLVYDYLNPIDNNQGVLSIFWWDIMVKIPIQFQFIQTSINLLETLYARQQIEINETNDRQILKHEKREVQTSSDMIMNGHIEVDDEIKGSIENDKHQEEWKNYGFFGKLKFYYRNNGLKQTGLYAIKKILPERNT